VVSKDRLTELTCEDVVFAAHSGQEISHEENKAMATDVHSKGSKGGHKISNGDEFDRELVELKL
jgi:hypothetical protein